VVWGEEGDTMRLFFEVHEQHNITTQRKEEVNWAEHEQTVRTTQLCSFIHHRLGTQNAKP